jgi:spore coat protein U-like protein
MRPQRALPGGTALRRPPHSYPQGTAVVPPHRYPRILVRAKAGLLAALALGLIAGRGEASTATGDATIQATLVGVCQLVSAPTLDFGNVGGVGTLPADVAASGSFNVACNDGLPYTVYLGDGLNRAGAGSGLRNMTNGTARLPYQLYKDSGHASVWDATGIGAGVTGGAGGVSGTGNAANQPLTVYGLIASGTTLPITLGAYSDTVLVTIAY